MGLRLTLVLTSHGQLFMRLSSSANASWCGLRSSEAHPTPSQLAATECMTMCCKHCHFQLLTMSAASYLDPLQAHLYLPALTVCDSIADLMPFQNLILTEDLMRAS